MRPGDLTPAQVSAWERMQDGAPEYGNPFLSPGFALAVGRVHQQARVAVLIDDGVEAGFLAFERNNLGAGSPIAAGIADQQCLVARPGVEWRPQALLAAAGLHSLKFENYPAQRLPDGSAHVVEYGSPVIDLRNGFRGYLAERRAVSKSLVPTMERKRRKLEREVGDLRFDFESTNVNALHTVMRWKSAQYSAMSEWDRFADPRTVALLEDLLAVRTPGCTGTLSVLYAGDEVAAAHFGLRSRTVICSWFPTYNPRLAKYSPGLLLHFLMAESAAELGVTTFDLGRGEHGYKDALKSFDLRLARSRLFRRSVPGLAHRLATAPRHHVRPLVKRHPDLEAVLVRGARRVREIAGAGREARSGVLPR
ncbi:GNAT family N-acetyltransferase [Pseudonocardia nigra]|uniref:GNAT family N-acetyltransferase n=1 Tax=Pseudonocardia nigra TaxID=1921578 RepID=UPI001C5EDCAD|nr:GNAT family N-acetyltransferase [Pseudonocardia nigra]